MGVTTAERRLQTISGATERLADSIRKCVDIGAGLDLELTTDLLAILDAITVYAVADGPEPESRRVFGGLRVVR